MMDFVANLLRALKEFDIIYVVVDWLMKSVHFLLMKTTYGFTQYAQIYINEIIQLHRVLISIISN